MALKVSFERDTDVAHTLAHCEHLVLAQTCTALHVHDLQRADLGNCNITKLIMFVLQILESKEIKMCSETWV